MKGTWMFIMSNEGDINFYYVQWRGHQCLSCPMKGTSMFIISNERDINLYHVQLILSIKKHQRELERQNDQIHYSIISKTHPCEVEKSRSLSRRCVLEMQNSDFCICNARVHVGVLVCIYRKSRWIDKWLADSNGTVRFIVCSLSCGNAYNITLPS